MIEFRNMSIFNIEDYLEKIGEKKFRGKQIFKWIHGGVKSFDDMTNLSKELREKLKGEGYIDNMKPIEVQKSKLDGTIKFLMELTDKNLVECVVMRYNYGNTICISTQVGCNMGCSFCASTLHGRVRNLSAGEMLGQILEARNYIGENIGNIVLMGMGEPLDNFENVLKFFKLLQDKEGLNIGMRHITLSTCGIVPKIIELADLNLQITLAVSLHAPNDELRERIMPIAKVYKMDDLIKALKYYVEKTNRRITFEYSLINGVNDNVSNALELAGRLNRMLCHVNLIPINPVRENSYKRSSDLNIKRFKETLESKGIETTIRRELGADIDAACGQLRGRFINNSNI